MKSFSWQQARFIDGPRKGLLCWVYLEDKKPFFAEKTQAILRQGTGLERRVVAINAHCARHWPGHLHGALLDQLEMLPKGTTNAQLDDICLGEELEREVFHAAAENKNL